MCHEAVVTEDHVMTGFAESAFQGECGARSLALKSHELWFVRTKELVLQGLITTEARPTNEARTRTERSRRLEQRALAAINKSFGSFQIGQAYSSFAQKAEQKMTAAEEVFAGSSGLKLPYPLNQTGAIIVAVATGSVVPSIARPKQPSNINGERPTSELEAKFLAETRALDAKAKDLQADCYIEGSFKPTVLDNKTGTTRLRPTKSTNGRRWRKGSEFGDGVRKILSPDDKAQFRALLLLSSNRCKNRLTVTAAALGRLMVNMIGENGQLDPSIEFLAERMSVNPSTILRSLKRLRDCGFVTWVKRIRRTSDTGWRTEQTSNAYCLHLPNCTDVQFTQGVIYKASKKKRSTKSSSSSGEIGEWENGARQLRLLGHPAEAEKLLGVPG